MKEKALEIAKQLGVTDFTASNGWLERFWVRHNIVFRSICGEAGDVNDATCEDWKDRLPSIVLINIERIHRSADLKGSTAGEHINNIFCMLKDSLESEIVKSKCINKKQTTIDNYFTRKDC